MAAMPSTRADVNGAVQIESNLPWEELAALPESYATAWTCLFRNLELMKGQTLLIRGDTSSCGLAALNLAVEGGAKVIATTRNRDSLQEAGGSWSTPSGVGGTGTLDSHRRG